jgi:Flp pilus assembly pilin Flp
MEAPLGDGRRSIFQRLRHVWFSEEGQDAAEYALVAAVVLAIAIGATGLLGGKATQAFSSAARSVKDYCSHPR